MEIRNQPLQGHERELLERALTKLETSRLALEGRAAEVALTALRDKLAGGNQRIRQERKPVTVLFADVSGFTAMSETMDHEIVNDVINSLWSRVDRAILDHGGRIDKHIGDAVMALYGALISRSDDAASAIRSALQIQSEIQEWKRELNNTLPKYQTQIQNIQLRIGIHAGEALLGTVGLVGEFTAIGATVNLANRLESAAPKGGILISEAAYQRAGDEFDVAKQEPIIVKGWSERIQVYTVEGVKIQSFQSTNGGLKREEPKVQEEEKELEHAIEVVGSKQSVLEVEVADIVLTALYEKMAELNGVRRVANVPQQRKQVAVLFADISGFTAMFETMEEAEVNAICESLWSRVDKAIYDHGGRVDKHIFDVVMALYGIPTAHEDDPERAIRSALQIQIEIEDWKKEQVKKLPKYQSQIENIHLRIGVNTGPALLGTVGTVGEFTAIGDTVNLAQRLEANAPEGGILISNDTHQHVRGIFDVMALEPIRVKGKSEPIQVFTVNGVKPRSFRDTTRGLEGVETRTIGRDAELEQMKKAFHATASDGTTHLITLVAEAGTGKSRVLFEFGKWLDLLEQPIQILKGRAGQETAQIPYSLLRGILSVYFGIQENDRLTVARQNLERGIARYTTDPETAKLYAHFIGHLIGLDYSHSKHLKGIINDARQVRDLAFHYGAEFFADVAHEHTIVIFLEDIHWADSGSLDFFDAVMAKQPDIPLLIIALTRSTLFEQRPDWGSAAAQQLRLDLPPLTETDTRRLVAEILQKAPVVPDAIVDMIVQKAEGSPFYVEELVKVLIEGGVILRGTDTWSIELDRLSDLKVPATLTGLLQARLDGLKPEARQTLQQASVVGRIFWVDVIERMKNPELQTVESAPPVSEYLNVLRSKELIYQYEESVAREASEFIFKNQILHDVTYESVLLRLRPVYHSQAAKGLVEVGGERVNEYAGRVGEHYERAAEWLKAAEWYLRAGKQAQNTYSNEIALMYYQKALNFVKEYGTIDQIEVKLEAYRRMGDVLNWQARYSDAVEIYNEMLKDAEGYHDLISQVHALSGKATSLGYQGDHGTSLNCAIQAETLARQTGEKLEIARTLLIQGLARLRLGESSLALSLGEQALGISSELDSPNDVARCLNLVGSAYYISGHIDKAEACLDKALPIFQELGNRGQAMDLLNNLGVIADARGDHETSFQRFDGALKIAQQVGYRDGEIVFLANRGAKQISLKNYKVAEEDLRQSISLAGVNGSWIVSVAFSYLAEALIGLERIEEAFYSARQALVLAEEDKSPENIGMAWRALGMVADKQNAPVHFSDWETHLPGDHDAEGCFANSLRIFTEAEIDMERARTLREWAHYKFNHGDRDQGAKMWQEAKETFAKIGAQMEVDRMDEFSG